MEEEAVEEEELPQKRLPLLKRKKLKKLLQLLICSAVSFWFNVHK